MVENLRIPPQNLEAEMSTLGAMMLDSEAIFKVADNLNSGDFYNEKHRIIYEAILDLVSKKEPIDILSVSNRLKEKNLLESIGGASYLTDLINSIPSASNISHYADIVRKKRTLRDLIAASQHINELGYKEENDIDSLLDEAEKKIFSIAQTSLKKQFASIKGELNEAWNRIDRLHKNKEMPSGVPTGFADLDNMLSGLQPSDLVILAARPSHGKTSLMLDIARSAAIKHEVPVGIFSLEMNSQQLADRFISAEARVNLWNLRRGRLDQDDFERISDALGKLSKAPIYIDDEAMSNVLQMRALARRLQAEHKLGLIIIDYLQLMNPTRNADSMVQQITEIYRSLKGLARELNVPVLALSQLSRAVEQRHPPVPRLSDLRESGAIEQDADVVMFIYREDKYKQNSGREDQADIIVAKHRNGPTGQATLFFNERFASFSNLAKEGLHPKPHET